MVCFQVQNGQAVPNYFKVECPEKVLKFSLGKVQKVLVDGGNVQSPQKIQLQLNAPCVCQVPIPGQFLPSQGQVDHQVNSMNSAGSEMQLNQVMNSTESYHQDYLCLLCDAYQEGAAPLFPRQTPDRYVFQEMQHRRLKEAKASKLKCQWQIKFHFRFIKI